MLPTIQIASSSGVSRGEAAIQPAYFTSSLFVDALRADIRELERIFSKHYYAQFDALSQSNASNSASANPFALFKELWARLGWQWSHLKVLEPRAREAFLNVTLRLFLECVEPTEKPMLRAVGIFALYTFYFSQPSTSVPKPLQAARAIPVPVDSLEMLLEFPEVLSGREEALKPYVQFVLQTLRPSFLILPPSEIQAQSPSVLPREEVKNGLDLKEQNDSGKKKTGRPSKAEKSQKRRAGIIKLDQWLEQTSYPSESLPAVSDPAGAAGLWRPGEEEGSQALSGEAAVMETTTHAALSQRPVASLNLYREKKAAAVSMLRGGGHADALERAGIRVLQRLKEIDVAAAERGLEVGTEGGEVSAIGRVEAAVNERQVLSLLEGGGLT